MDGNDNLDRILKGIQGGGQGQGKVLEMNAPPPPAIAYEFHPTSGVGVGDASVLPPGISIPPNAKVMFWNCITPVGATICHIFWFDRGGWNRFYDTLCSICDEDDLIELEQAIERRREILTHDEK